MKNCDYIIRGMIPGMNIRFVMAEIGLTVTASVKIHDTDPVSTLIFGEALLTAALCSPLLEGEERYTFRWEYSGYLKRILVDVDAQGKLRGIPYEPHLMEKAVSEIDVYGALDGEMSVVKSCNGKILNSGITKSTLLDISDDTGFFFSTSDQVETEIECVVSLNPDPEQPIDYAAGIMLQAMPDCDLEMFAALRNELHSAKIKRLLSQVMPSEKKLWKVLEVLTGLTLPGDGQQIVYEFSGEPEYKCTCSHEKLRMSLKTLGMDELRSIFDNDQCPEVKCEFCNMTYEFTRKDFDL